MKRSWTAVFFTLSALALLVPRAAGAMKAPPEIRVGLVDGANSVQICIPDGGELIDGAGFSVARADEGALIIPLWYEAGLVSGPVDSSALFTALPGTGMIRVNGRPYRGKISVQAAGGGLVVVETVGLEDYLRGVVPREVYTSWPEEALKAQAVAARTYTLANSGRHSRRGYDLCADVHCQAYGGFFGEHPRTDSAVSRTAGVVATYKGKLISALYHSSSGGHTEDSANVWGWDTPYLKGVPDTDVSTYAYWFRFVTPFDIEDALRANGREVGAVMDVTVAKVGVSGRVVRVLITGAKGRVELSGEQLRTFLNLRSTNFTVSWDPAPSPGPLWISTGLEPLVSLPPVSRSSAALGLLAPGYMPPHWVIMGRGWGHGVGLSQWGAMAMAEEGHTYEDILRYYYQGIELEKWFEEAPTPALEEEGPS